jgi:hypothetical protein
MAKILRDDGYAGIRARVFALNAFRFLAHGRIGPADAERLIAEYQTRRAHALAASRAYR